MPVKDWFKQMQPVQLYVILVLTVVFFLVELVVSHFTHALTLLMNSYHMLCNILALSGCIATIKYGSTNGQTNSDVGIPNNDQNSGDNDQNSKVTDCQDPKDSKKSPARATQEKKLKNTFGWARIDVISMLICCVFLASLCFSIFVEALQTLIHISHQDEMHHPISVLCIGAAGLLLNGVCYLLIGGYTFHQGSFLYITESGDVILNKVIVKDSAVTRGQRRLSRSRNVISSPPRQREGCWEMVRDIHGCVFIIVCALLVYFVENEDIAKYIDPFMSLLSALTITFLSYPYMKESCLILLQTMPDTMNIDSLKSELKTHFPDILNVHDLHVWQLTASKIISTVHIIFQNPKVYHKIAEEIKEFFAENGITQVTIQPEFFKENISIENLGGGKIFKPCLVACQGEACKLNHCCPNYQSQELDKLSGKSSSLPPQDGAAFGIPELRAVRVLQEDDAASKSSLSNCSYEETTKLHNEINNSLNEITEKDRRGEEEEKRSNDKVEAATCRCEGSSSEKY